MQKEVEDHFRAKAAEIVEQMVGRGNARVQVSATLNFDKVERTSLTMDPEKQATQSEQKAEIVPGAQGGAGSTNTATAYENSKSTETFSGAVGGLRRLTVAVLVNDRMVAVPAAAGKKADAKSPAPAPELKPVPRDSAELARIDALVRSAVGFDSARGDVVRVINATFDAPVVAHEEVPAPTIVTRLQEFQRLIVAVLGLVFAFAVALLALRAIKGNARPAPPVPALEQPEMMPQLAPAPPEPPVIVQPLPPRVITANAQIRERVVASVEEQPDVAAKLVRAWMKD
jgi:flagellar M-ring protein FliF